MIQNDDIPFCEKKYKKQEMFSITYKTTYYVNFCAFYSTLTNSLS